jgi:hypothetical protein
VCRPWLSLQAPGPVVGSGSLYNALDERNRYQGTLRTFRLKSLIHLPNVTQGRLPFECDGPILDVSQDAVPRVDVEHRYLQNRHQIVHKLPGSNLHEKVITTILDANIGELYTKAHVSA